DLFGLSCWTANRRGVAYVSKAIKEAHPKAHVVIGGPHATPLAKEMLAHHAEIDTVCTGESEPAFLELADKLQKGESTGGIHGTWFRGANGIEEAPERKNISDLDTLAFVHDYFPTH